MLFPQTFRYRNENQCCANEKGGERHAINAFCLGENNETDEGPEQHDAGHLEFG